MGENPLAQAQRSCGLRRWRDACANFALVDTMDAQSWEQWAVSAHLIGQSDTACLAWTNAHHAWLDAGNPRQAVTCAFWQGLTLLQRGEHARGGGWLARAATVLRQCPSDAPEHGYLRVSEALQILDGDPAAALDVFDQVVAIAVAGSDRDLETLAGLGRAQSLVKMGETASGIIALDEAMVGVTGDDVSPLVAGVTYCAAIIACQQALDLQRAQQWTTALSDWCASQQDIKPYQGQCLVHRSQLLQLRGRWAEAITEARHACEHLADPPGDPVQGMAFYQLGELLRLRGRFDEAQDAYAKANQHGHSVQPGMALLRLAQGRTEVAMGALRRVIEEAGAPADRVHSLAAYIEACLIADDLLAGRRALDELTQVADSFGSGYLSAICDHATGTVLLADGNAAEAVAALQAATSGWHRLAAPYQAARSAMHLGAAYRALGDHDSATMEWRTARRQFTDAGAVIDLARLSVISGTATPGPAELTAREAEILTHVAAGRTNRQIADALVISEHTVRRHLQNVFAKLDLPSRAAATAWAYQHHLLPLGPD